MKKITQHISHKLHQEVHPHHWLVVILTPILIYGIVHLYAQAMSTSLATSTPIHTRIVYYDGTFSQDIAIEEIDTSVYFVNQTSEPLQITSYEYAQDGRNILSNAAVQSNSQLLVSTKKPSLIFAQNPSHTKQSLVLVGRNKNGDEVRAGIIKNAILENITPQNKESADYAALYLSRIRQFDVSTNAICMSVYNTIVETAGLQPTQTAEQTCGTTSHTTYTKATTSLGTFLKNTIIKRDNMLEFTMPDGY
jgi:hypothetical protein